MSLYPYICKYGKFPVGHPVIHAGDACRDTEAMLQIEGQFYISLKIIVPYLLITYPRFPIILDWKPYVPTK